MKKLKIRTPFVVALGTIMLAGCASTPDPIIGASVTKPLPEFGQLDYSHERAKTYLLRPADRISLTVLREPEFSMSEVRIGVEGNISLPMLGSIPVAGMTIKQLEQDLTMRLAAVGLKVPIVSVNIVDYSSHLVTVEGSVTRPGVYPFQPGARLSSAIALAAGPSVVAKRDQVIVFRETEEGIMVAKFDHRMINQGTMLDPVLQPGDRVVLGTDGLSVLWQDFLKTIPAFGALVLATSRLN